MNIILITLLLAVAPTVAPTVDCEGGKCSISKSNTSSNTSSITNQLLDIGNTAKEIEDLMAAKAKIEVSLLLTNDALAASEIKLKASRVKLNTYLDNIGKPKPIVVEKVVQIVEVYSDGCQYCDSDATIANYVKNGLNIVKTKDSKWSVSSTPTYIMTVDGKEINRVVGYLSEKTLQKWQLDIKDWLKDGLKDGK